MPMPFQCIYCAKYVREEMNGICEDCKKEEEKEEEQKIGRAHV